MSDSPPATWPARGLDTELPAAVSSLGSSAEARGLDCGPLERAAAGAGWFFLKSFEKAPNMFSGLT